MAAAAPFGAASCAGRGGGGRFGRGGGGRNAAEMVVVDEAGSEQTELSEVRDPAGKEDSCMADPFLELEMGTSGSADCFAAVCVATKQPGLEP